MQAKSTTAFGFLFCWLQIFGILSCATYYNQTVNAERIGKTIIPQENKYFSSNDKQFKEETENIRQDPVLIIDHSFRNATDSFFITQSSRKRLMSIVNVDNTKLSQNNMLIRNIYSPGHSVSIPEKCPEFGKRMKLVVIILSDPIHYTARKAIRETWGLFGHRKDVSVLFMLGITTDIYLERKLKHEQEVFADIVRGNFLDTYTNLTLKTVSILEWVDRYCAQVQFVLKADDDVFINMPRLLTFVRVYAQFRNVIFGRRSDNTIPHRDKDSKYYVSLVNYKQPVFPPFLIGPAYLISSDIIHNLYIESLKTTFLKLEDVFTTGIVARNLGINRVHVIKFINQRESFSICELQKSISLHSINYHEQYDLWGKLFICEPSCPMFCDIRSHAEITSIDYILFYILFLKFQII
ncbi:beta-1,3-galactosyltransferase 1-like [Cephus cinctus]|uniref:Hexosyltransferase n=1 Tax=Cephus cinctus TaxID=211228 RepID=A0AAJ7C1H1_CEPCN|nr:beta-1,3-galactosyltransferase 1-like [Cephus cinctus]XP_024942650.1 beta-1,3-galactosyltransferase 1-like [Cephus cinctus]